MTTAGYVIIFSYSGMVLWLTLMAARSGWSSNSQRALVWSLVPAGVTAVFAVGLYLSDYASAPHQEPVQNAQVGIDPNATRDRLREMSTVLITADKKGDSELAKTVLFTAVALLVTIEHQPNGKKPGTALRNCALAARHLSAGAESVTNGGRWLNEDQFQEAAGDCRT